MGFLELWWLVAPFYVDRHIFDFFYSFALLSPLSSSLFSISMGKKRNASSSSFIVCVFVYMTIGVAIKCDFLYPSLSYCLFRFWLKSGVQLEVIDVSIAYYFVKWCFIL